jgi:AraC-like DNA-binding protein
MFIFPSFYNFLRYYLGVVEKVPGYMRAGIILFLSAVLVRVGVVLYAMYGLDGDPDAFIERYNVLEEIVGISFSLFVFAHCFILVFRKEVLYRDFLDYDDVRWIKVFMILGIVNCFVWLIGLSLRAKLGYQDFAIYYPLNLASSIVLYWIGYQGLFRYTIVQERVQLRQSIRSGKALTTSVPGGTNPGLDEKHAREFKAIQDYILKEQRFLDPLLSLNSMAGEVSVSPGHLSRLINTHGNKNFTDFINEYRVEQAKSILKDPEFENYTIAAIGLECGFNSKSTFYSAFKKFTSLSPSGYKRGSVQVLNLE